MIEISTWDFYKERVQHLGKTERERRINTSIRNFNKLAPNSPTHHKVTIGEEEIYVEILSTDFTDVKKVISINNKEVYAGNYIQWNDSYWLIKNVDFNDEIYRTALMQQCNNILRWQNQTTREIIERRYVVDNVYTMSVNPPFNRNSIASSNRTFRLILPKDEETMMLDLDRRLILEVVNNKPIVYTVIGIDTLSNSYDNGNIGGCVVLQLEQAHYNSASDNAELMIADYLEPYVTDEPDEPIEPPEPGDGEEQPIVLKSEILGMPTIKINWRYREYQAVFYNEDDEINEAIECIWEIECSEELQQYLSYTTEGNVLRVKVATDCPYTGKIFTITLSDPDNIYPIQKKEIEVVNIL